MNENGYKEWVGKSHEGRCHGCSWPEVFTYGAEDLCFVCINLPATFRHNPNIMGTAYVANIVLKNIVKVPKPKKPSTKMPKPKVFVEPMVDARKK